MKVCFLYSIIIIISLFTIFPIQHSSFLHGEEKFEDLYKTSSGFDLCIAFTGEENGYLEPCGCSEKKIGGFCKRNTLVDLLRRDYENCVLLSLGDLPKNAGRQDEIKMEIILNALDLMGYAAHNIGEKDINMGLELLDYLSHTSNVNFISSNIVNIDTQDINVKPYVIKEIKLNETILKIGIFGILSPELVDNYSQRVVADPILSLKFLISELNEDTDFLILLSHAEMEESIRIAEFLPEFDLVISGHGIDEPELYVKKIKDTYVIPAGEKGKYLGSIIFPMEYGRDGRVVRSDKADKTKKQKISAQLKKLEYYGLPDYYNLDAEIKEPAIEITSLDEKYADSAVIKGLLRIYQQRLKDEELVKYVDKTYPPSDTTFIGNVDCAICHNVIFKHWQDTRHASAYETLVKAGHENDPECLSCHTIGLRYFTGFETIESTPGMKGVGCESCHGPGSKHKETQTEDYGMVDAEGCIVCHEEEHSPNFQFDDYWQKIAHPVVKK